MEKEEPELLCFLRILLGELSSSKAAVSFRQKTSLEQLG